MLGVLSLAEPSTGVRKTLERQLREQNNNRSEPAAQHINSDTTAPLEDFSKSQMLTIRQLIQDNATIKPGDAAVNAFQA